MRLLLSKITVAFSCSSLAIFIIRFAFWQIKSILALNSRILIKHILCLLVPLVLSLIIVISIWIRTLTDFIIRVNAIVRHLVLIRVHHEPRNISFYRFNLIFAGLWSILHTKHAFNHTSLNVFVILLSWNSLCEVVAFIVLASFSLIFKLTIHHAIGHVCLGTI